MFLVSASIEFFSARPYVLQCGDLFCACQAICKRFCKLCQSNWMQDIRSRNLKVGRHSLKCYWQELLVPLAHLEVEVLDLTQETVGLSGYNAPHHTRLVVMVNYPIISLRAEDGTAGRFVLVPVLGYLVLW